MPRVYVVNHDSISDKPFDLGRDDLPYHDDIDEYDLRVQMTVFCCEEEDGAHTMYPSYALTPTHTRRVKTNFALMEFPAGAFENTPILAWVQVVSHAELQHTIGGLAPKCGDKMIHALNSAANTGATHLFSNRYDKQTLMPKCIHWVGKGWGDEWGDGDHRTVLL